MAENKDERVPPKTKFEMKFTISTLFDVLAIEPDV